MRGIGCFHRRQAGQHIFQIFPCIDFKSSTIFNDPWLRKTLSIMMSNMDFDGMASLENFLA